MLKRWTAAAVMGLWMVTGASACGGTTPEAPPPVVTASAPPVVAAPERPGLIPLPDWQQDGGDWSMLDRVFDGRSIVLLGESLHVTAEFPLVRLPILRRLHEQLGFDVIAFEGSMIDAWLAQDDLLREPDAKDAVRNAGRLGWLSLWNTEEMFRVLSYIAATQKTDKPLYFASMDIQPGMGGHPMKKQLLRKFIERVLAYAGEDVAAAEALAETLEPLRTCAGKQPPPPERAAAIEKLTRTIASADEAVRARSDMHADALSLLPNMLDQRLQHCEEAGTAGMGDDGQFDRGRYWVAYKEARDRHQAYNVLGLRERVSRSHRVVVWGHHTHVAYGAAGARARESIAGVLKRSVPGETYALGLYAGSGQFVQVQDGPRDALIPTDVPAHGDACCSGLDALRKLNPGPHGYLLDLRLGRDNPDLAFARKPHGFPLEGEAAEITLADELDGVVFVPAVSEAVIGL